MSNHIKSVIDALRKHFASGLTRPMAYRQQQLDGLKRFLIECESDIEAALNSDLGKSSIEAYATEINVTLSELKLVRKNLAAWMKPKRVSTQMLFWPGKSRVHAEPYGVVTIISPWNYPLQLTLVPLIGAIAAGNCIVVKPSELAPATSRLLAEKLKQYLDDKSVQVIEGGATETTSLLDEPVDYIFYTGNGSIGKIVMTAAARHLTPVTLELGGKSPCVVDKDANIEVAARRIMWGKFTNAGQTCIAPDYVLAHQDIVEALLEQMKKMLIQFYGSDPAASADYGRVINARHFHRLKRLLPDGKIVVGGELDEQRNYIAPTILRDVNPESALMTEEIFGPLLPVFSVKNVSDAIAFINRRPKPLAIYLFTNNNQHRMSAIEQTSSGGVCLNHVLLHVAIPALPFGGVGASGMGAYHGKASFDTFTHYKSVFSKPSWPDLSIMYPPYHSILKKILRWFI